MEEIKEKRYVFVDFEMQPVDHKEHPDEWSIARHEIIEFGAVMLDDKLKEVDQFQSYVKPRYSEEIQETVEAMTGITADTVKDADDFEKVLGEFLEWCEGAEYAVYAWSGADKGQLTHEIALKQVEKTPELSYMLSNWFDYQKIFTKAIGRRLAVSLDKAVEACGMDFEGQMHDALWDARNTSRLFRLTSDKKNFRKLAPRIKHALDSKEHFTASLGDMVDFKNFNLPEG
ncbi:MAG: exonuclease domain-containing protein [Lachnospiraceae bacterium]|nr:exonuclease domain-containing protein [Lachnospiraceae bacterium]